MTASTSPAYATDQATAQALFDQGRKLMAQERWGDACPKLEESQRLDPAGGTLLHLALCREHEGRIATAWALYQDALAQAKHDARKDRAKIAQERIDALAPRLPRMRIRVAPANKRTEGFTVSRDDSVVGEAQWGEQLPVDPGPHVLSAKANGRKPWTKKVDIPARAQEIVVEIPELETEAPAEVAKTADANAIAAPTRLEEAQRGEGQRTAGVVITGAGIAGVIVGSAFGIISISKNNEADRECTPPGYTRCSAKGIDAGNSATSAGNISTIAFIAGGALVAGGLTLYFTAPSGSAVALTPSATPRSASLGFSGRF
jgi:hypothetical protein